MITINERVLLDYKEEHPLCNLGDLYPFLHQVQYRNMRVEDWEQFLDEHRIIFEKEYDTLKKFIKYYKNYGI